MKSKWPTKKLEDCLDKVIYTVKIQRKDFLESGDFPIISQEAEFINGYWNNKKDLFKVEKPVVIFGDHTQILKYVDFDFVLGADGVKILSPKSSLDPKFFYYFLQSIDLKSLGYARHYRLLKEFKISLPSLPEQHRIVKILDKAFGEIAKAKANTEKNLQNSRELFESYLQGVFVKSKYEYKALGIVCKVIGGGTPSKTGSNFAKYYNGDISWATVRDMRNDILKVTEHKITKEAVKNSSTNIVPKNNVVIASRVGLGRVCLLENDTAINQDLRGIIPLNPHNLSVMYLFWWLKSISEIIIKNGTGATVHGVKLPFIKSLEIPLPLITEQKAIVKKLDALAGEVKKLKAIYQQKLDDLEELKKSLLKKAFAGEL